MSKPKIIKGRRVDAGVDVEFVAGCYGLSNAGDWMVWPPGTKVGMCCPADIVTVHPEDGTITVDHAINADGWAGYLKRGVWHEGIDLSQDSSE